MSTMMYREAIASALAEELRRGAEWVPVPGAQGVGATEDPLPLAPSPCVSC